MFFQVLLDRSALLLKSVLTKEKLKTMLPISVIILTKNEEALIGRCIKSASWSNEILVLDSCSTDRTREIASSLGARVYEQPWLGWSQQRNKAISLASNDWVFILEADEIVTDELITSIKEVMVNPNDKGVFAFDRPGDFLGVLLPNFSSRQKKLCLVRLFNRKFSAYDINMRVHEEVCYSGNVSLLKGTLLHWRGYAMNEYINSINNYTSVEAEVLDTAGVKGNILLVMLRPLLRFVWCYFIHGGFRLGSRGLIHAMLAATTEYIRYAKLWELQYAPRVLNPPVDIYPHHVNDQQGSLLKSSEI
jgi:(heptosyl)LPS beta-1,4-glucosyltransferase